jgi:hypothetical protein
VDRFIQLSSSIKSFGNAVPTRHAQLDFRWVKMIACILDDGFAVIVMLAWPALFSYAL